MKLKDLLSESQHLDYRRMNVGEEEDKGMTKEEKRAFLEAVSAYRQLGEMISHKGDLSEIHESIKNIVENANSLTLKETGDWFDRVTVQRHMKSMNESYKIFSNSIKEVVTLQQRMESAYDEIGEVLGKYYEIKEGNEFGAERAKAIAKGEDEFEVGGKTFKVTNVDDEDKENAKKFANESMKLSDLIKEAKVIVYNEKTGERYEVLSGKGKGDLMIAMKALQKAAPSHMKYSIKESVNESKFAVVNANNGNTIGQGMKDQAVNTAKKMGGEKSGYFVVPANNALKARRAAEKYNFDFKNPKLKSILFDLQFENVDESVNEEIKVGSSVTVNYPTLRNPIKGKVKHILKSPKGLVYVLNDPNGVWDEKYVSLKESVNEGYSKTR